MTLDVPAPLFRPSRRGAVSGRPQQSGRDLARAPIPFRAEQHRLSFRQGRQSGAFHGGDVNEDILAAGLRLDEAKALGGVEPSHNAPGEVGVRARRPKTSRLDEVQFGGREAPVSVLHIEFEDVPFADGR